MSLLFEILERVATLRWVKSLGFHNTSGQQIGALSLEGGLVRFGVQVEGQPYCDDAFVREAAPFTGLLTKLLQRAPITPEEIQRLHGMPLLLRRTLRSVTARALRRLALLSDLSQLRASEKDLDGAPPPSSLHLSFPPVELMLAAGGSGAVRYADLAARMYETPPDLAKERWLFEFQVGDPIAPWPIMTTRMAERKANTVTQFGLLGQSLARHIVATRHGNTRRPLAAEVVVTADHAYYVISTDRYLTLLIYESAHTERLLRSMEISVLGSGELHRVDAPAPSLHPGATGNTPRELPLPSPVELSVAPDVAAMAKPNAPLPRPGSRSTAASSTSAPPVQQQPAKPPPLPPVPMIRLLPPSPRGSPPAAASKPDTRPAQESESAPVPVAVPVAVPVPEEREQPPFVLAIYALTARIEERTILCKIDLCIPERGVCALMGPGGSGKSSLIGILAGRNRAASGWALSGEITYAGAPLGTAQRPAAIGQKFASEADDLRAFLLAHLDEGEAEGVSNDQLMEVLARVRLEHLADRLNPQSGAPLLSLGKGEWRQLAIGRELLSDPPLLCLDEPTAGLEDAEARPLLSVLAAEGKRRAVLFVTHNQEHARACCDRVILLAGGRIQEHRTAAAFFSAPQSQAAQDYVRTGGCSVPSSDPQPLPEADLQAIPGVAIEALPTPVPVAVPPVPPEPPSVVWECPAPVLSLRGFGLSLGKRAVLSAIDLDIADRGIHLLIGQDEAERRLFRAALGGPHPRAMSLIGQAIYQGRPLREGVSPIAPSADARQVLSTVLEYLTGDLPARGTLSRPALAEHARQFLQQAGHPELIAHLHVALCDLEQFERACVELLRAAALAPSLIVLETPLGGLPPEAQSALLQMLEQQAAQRALLLLVRSAAPFLEHGFRPAPKLAWLSEGRVLGAPPLLPETDPASVLSPALAESAARREMPPPPAGSAPRATRGSGPRGFKWLRQGSLAGMPAPGGMAPLDYDLELIRDTGISHLITLTEEPLAPDSVRSHDLEPIFFPIPDMGAPEIAAAAELCRRVADLLSQGHAVGYHCRAGLGRTGTLLAAQIISEGTDASSALAQVRAIEPGWVQSAKQEEFLHELQKWLRRT